jgi:hypothetical protein
LPATTPAETSASITAEQVVSNLAVMNRFRAQALHAYEGMRTYRVEYRGFPSSRAAEMIVKVKFSAPGEKEFAIQSTTGSTLIIDKVFKKMLEAEKEASNAEMQRRTALTDDNYRFTLIGIDPRVPGTYALKVVPRTNDKFLYRGQIWVDAKDFAVTRIEAEPAKNPSFWTKKSEIVQVYSKVSDFWLPASNHSVSVIRLGGRAELSIEYKEYEITDASQVSSSTAHRATAHTESAHAQCTIGCDHRP